MNSKHESLLRIPATAAPPPTLTGRDTRVQLRDGKVTLIASGLVSPLYRARAVAGSIVITSEIDLAAMGRRLAPKVLQASLRGLD